MMNTQEGDSSPSPRPRRARRRLVAGLAAIGVVWIVSLSGCFERLAFVPIAGIPSPTPAEMGWERWRSVFFPSRDGTRLNGWLIAGNRPPGQEAQAIVVHAHGNGGNLGYQLIPAVHMCLELGSDVLMFDYRSFGRSDSGRLHRFSVVEDLAGALTFARSQAPGATLLLLGQSMGGATSALAMREPELLEAVHGLCLVSAFADWNVEVCDALKSSPFTWLLAYPVAYGLCSPWRPEPTDGLARWPAAKPLLLIHGEADRVVPVHHLDLFLACLGEETRAAVQVVRLTTGRHNALGSCPEEGEQDVRAALRQWVTRAIEARRRP
jgi:alpha-beta hydrolase superfamily lysophospholipase